MNEIDIILLYQRELPAVLKYIIIFKSGFKSYKELTFHSPEPRAETEAEHTVLVSGETVLVENAAVPIISFPELTFSGFPVVADLTEKLKGIAVFERVLISDSGIKSRWKKESGIDCKLTLSRSPKGDDGTYECDKELLHGLLV